MNKLGGFFVSCEVRQCVCSTTDNTRSFRLKPYKKKHSNFLLTRL